MTKQELQELINESVAKALNTEVEVLSEAAIAENEFNEAYSVLESCLMEEYILAEEVDMLLDEDSRSWTRRYERSQGRRKGESKKAFRKRMDEDAKAKGKASFSAKERYDNAEKNYDTNWAKYSAAKKEYGSKSPEAKHLRSEGKKKLRSWDNAENAYLNAYFKNDRANREALKAKYQSSSTNNSGTEKIDKIVTDTKEKVQSVNKKVEAEKIAARLTDNSTTDDAKSTALTVVAKDMGSNYKVKDGKIISLFKNPDGSLNKKAIAVAALGTATAASIGAAAVALRKKKKAQKVKEQTEKK